MLTDIFARRYTDVPLRDSFEERDRRLLVQAIRIIEEQLYPPYHEHDVNEWAQQKWKLVHDKLSTELGSHELSPRFTGIRTLNCNEVCRAYVCREFTGLVSPDQFIKERLSFIELAFRERGEDISAANKELPKKIIELGLREKRTPNPYTPRRLPVRNYESKSPEQRLREANQALNDSFRESIDELNTRFRQADYDLNYHNGFIQIAEDPRIEEQIETPFWALLTSPKWQNVDTDIKEAIDLRDSGGRDPAWYAAKALESTIKIVSNDKAWTSGNEKGPHDYINNLVSKKNGRFIETWEADSLKGFFKKIRNPFGHGAGDGAMPTLTRQQTNWAIEFCMSWIKSLIERT